ncbi:fused response regulator/thioredoxin-disulfide reductase [Phycicoccus sp. Root101]|nr:fused response regulator/thioredoxin-disulfide reductase [Phycicoccus sp. Root101]
MAVDDDPQVSRAVARDLRRRYAQQYRVIRAESGDEAIMALRELAMRGDSVALLMADYRMPVMSGIAFLEQALTLYPTARRVLLTAYADTEAAIDAINVVDLDHYLLKPWSPPEELLYPVLDDLLDEWEGAGPAQLVELRVVGHRWSAATAAVRNFLVRAQAAYAWFPIDEPAGEQLAAAVGLDPAKLPAVITAAGEVLVEPTEADLARCLGLATVPVRTVYDLVVAGAGPAGLAAAVYGASEGLKTLLVERSTAGGQAGQSSRIENYLGFPDGVTGAQLTERARRQAAKFGAEMVTTRTVTGLERNGAAHTVSFADGSSVAAHAVLLATGVSYTTLDIPGVEELTGFGVYYGASPHQAVECGGNDVFIVGGANSAGQAAIHFAHRARLVTMLVRGPNLAASMSQYLADRIAATANIRVKTRTEVIGASGTTHLEQLTLADHGTGVAETVPAQWLFLFIGAQPRTDWLGPDVCRDRHGFIVTGPDLIDHPDFRRSWPLPRSPYHLESSAPGVFVAGDSRANSGKRVASAVGEGAMAVMLINRYLAQS